MLAIQSSPPFGIAVPKRAAVDVRDADIVPRAPATSQAALQSVRHTNAAGNEGMQPLYSKGTQSCVRQYRSLYYKA